MPANYIIFFKDTVSKEEIQKYSDEVNRTGGKVTNVYDSVINGFSAELSADQLQAFESLLFADVIDYIEADGVASI